MGDATVSGVTEVFNTGSEMSKSGFNSARESVKYAGNKLYEGGAVAGSTIKGKLDETGVTENVKYAGGKIYEGGAAAGTYSKTKLDESGVSEKASQVGSAVVTNVKYAGGVVSEKINANPTLSGAKTAAAEKIGAATSYMSGLVWGKTEENEEEKKEEDDGFEETKEESEPQ